jgi:hypothetical protein
MHSSDMRSKIMERDVFDEDDLGECDGVGRRCLLMVGRKDDCLTFREIEVSDLEDGLAS